MRYCDKCKTKLKHEGYEYHTLTGLILCCKCFRKYMKAMNKGAGY